MVNNINVLVCITVIVFGLIYCFFLKKVNGHLVVVYNVGTNDHPIGEANVNVNDNSYHLIRFVRSGPNSTLQVDDNSMQTHYPSGK